MNIFLNAIDISRFHLNNFEVIRINVRNNKYGIQKYTKGICYYRAEIKTGAETKIVHNNYYKLSVSKITELGDPGTNIPTPGNPLTYLKLNITVAPWTVWNNDIIL